MDSALISRGDILEAAATIEPLPASITRLMSVVAQPDFDTAAIVDIVARDTALAGEVLAQANSASSGPQRLIGDLRQAAARIGAAAIVEIAVRRTMQSRMAGEVVAYGLGPDEMWRHSLTASIAGDVVRKAATRPIAPMITTAALLHDIGKLVIAKCLSGALTDSLVAAAEADSISLAEAERKVIGIDHGEVGGVIVRAWGLPVSVQTALTQHHSPNAEDSFIQALILADQITHAVADLDDGEVDEVDLSPMLHESGPLALAIGISPSKLPALVETTAETAKNVAASYSN